MINRVHLEGFKLLRDVEFELGRFHVLVGENGSGKSSVLEGLHYLLQLSAPQMRGDGTSHGRLHEFFQGDRAPEQLASRPASDRFRLSISTDSVRSYAVEWDRVRASGPEGAFRMGLHRDGPSEGLRESPLTNLNSDAGSLYGRPLISDVSAFHLDSVVRLRLDANRLAADHYAEDPSPQIDSDGTGLASVLQELQNARDGRFDRIEADLAKVVPSARRIRTKRATIVRTETMLITVNGQHTKTEQSKPYVGAGIEVEWGDVGWVPARHLSEGTQLALGLCTVLHHRPPSMLLLDDLDKALHPKAQRELVQLLLRALDTKKDLQILATTHSPFVVDEFDPKDVLVVGSVDGRSSSIRRLADHPNWSSKSGYLEAGEFWSAVGERWAAEKQA